MSNGDPPLSMDPRRVFSRADVRRAWERQGRECALCRRRIPFDLMHGDHIVPWSAGGRTSSANLQALCGSCNLRKGSRPQFVVEQRFRVDVLQPGQEDLRAWQAEALPVALDAIFREPVLIEACPGAGKTRFGLELAYRLVAALAISRVLIVVPTLGIADGWRRAASSAVPGSPTLPLHSPRDWRPVSPIGDRWLGAISTYQSLFAATDMYLAHVTDPGHRTLVIFDEVHHAGANAAWGKSAQEAFAADAAAILSLTGTPFRTARDAIVFVPSEGGSARPHYRYSYDVAIADRACRPVQFVEVRGKTTFRTEDRRTHTVSFDDSDLTDVGQRRRLRSALEWIEPRSIAAKMLEDANQYIVGLRRAGDRDAAGLVVCVDCDHADKVATFMAPEILGSRRPIVACSRTHDDSDPNPANAINYFARSHDPWIVAVNMVSEGIDIPRLRVIVYLTNRLTLLAFRQIVGRVVRVDPANVDDHGRVYVPADHRLLEMARKVTDEVNLLPPPLTIHTEPAAAEAARITGATADRAEFETLKTTGAQGGAFDTSGREAAQLLIQCARLFIEREGLVGTDPESLAFAAGETPALRDALLALSDDV